VRISAVTPMIIASCHSSWIFDIDRGRFRRVLKVADVGPRDVATPWSPYYGLELDPNSESFVVLLNPEGTRLLSSWRHTGDCVQCGGHAMPPLSCRSTKSEA
jgi:hypothetical protein